ncbi:MAG: PhzF family phenazine biosynthesis protein [Ornithinibacter sp.]
MAAVRFVDVFSESTCRGNALAVFHDADDLTAEQMATIALWTNLSETTFLCAPTDPGADYRVRIFTTGGELPFAGHPTLGSAHAWLEAGGRPASAGVVVQQCDAGLVEVRRDERLRFAAPPLTRTGPVEAAQAARVVTALGLDPADVLETAWVDNGPGWIGVLVRSPDAVLAAVPDPSLCAGLKAGFVAVYPPGAREDGVAAEVRAIYSDGRDVAEDPVTGSLNAGLAQWLVPAGHLPEHYVAAQGTVIGRLGRVHVDVVDGRVWVGGATRTVITGERPGP